MMDDLIFSFWGYLIVAVSCVLCCNLGKRFKNYINRDNSQQIISTENRQRNVQQITLNQLNELVSGNSSIMITTNINSIIERNIIENNKMDIYLYTKTDKYSSTTKKECTICLENIIKNDDIRILPCFHIYHQNCVDSWLIKKTTCPNCCENINSTSTENSEIIII